MPLESAAQRAAMEFPDLLATAAFQANRELQVSAEHSLGSAAFLAFPVLRETAASQEHLAIQEPSLDSLVAAVLAEPAASLEPILDSAAKAASAERLAHLEPAANPASAELFPAHQVRPEHLAAAVILANPGFKAVLGPAANQAWPVHLAHLEPVDSPEPSLELLVSQASPALMAISFHLAL